jgi:mRNA-degrading endonuclease RelE of RelBE toxin-antitoxin system
MVNVSYSNSFEKSVKKVKSPVLKAKIRKQIRKIIDTPSIGKPMRYSRKGTRELHISPFRLSYAYIPEKDEIYFLAIYHKDEQ